MMIRKIFCALIICLSSSYMAFLVAQITPSDGRYVSPVDIVSGLSGTFAELRSNHFHSGIDIRTGGAVGKNIYAIADGYVSRISVSPYGYGNALYINHLDGKMSVYAHLLQFNDTIAQWVKEEQYRRKSFAINVFPSPHQFPVQQGELIALSGNSGGSGGPHLHFELRDIATGNTLNVLKEGFTIPDDITPSIRQVLIFPHDAASSVKQKNQEVVRQARGNGNSYRLEGNDTITAWGSICFGIDAIDRSHGSTNGNGIYAFRVKIDQKPFFSLQLDQFSFDETRDINSLINYRYYKNSKKRFIQTEKQVGNRLKIYDLASNDGIFNCTDHATHEVDFEVEDANGNKSYLKFWLKSEEHILPAVSTGKLLIERQKEFTLTEEQFVLKIPKDAVYEDVPFDYSVFDGSDSAFLSSVFQLGDESVPLKKKMEISIFPDFNRCSNIPRKSLLLVNLNGKSPKAVKTTDFPLFLTAQVFDFGKYTLMADTVAPVIKLENVWEGKDVSHQQSIRVKIYDNLSGIDRYIGTLNGEWILMEYDAKNNRLEYHFDERLKKGDNKLVISVIDAVGNTKKVELNLKNGSDDGSKNVKKN